MTITQTRICRLSTTKLEALRDQAEAKGNWPLFEAYEAELEAREDAESDPAADHEDTPSLDAPEWLWTGTLPVGSLTLFPGLVTA